jgi:formylmethanofuran dehydrogenase subunit E
MKKGVPAICRVCGKTHYSKTTNKDGKIICPKCAKLPNFDKLWDELLKMWWK